MKGSLLRFYLGEGERLHGVLLWEWLLAQGNRLGIRGGSAFRAVGGFGRRHAVHEDRFFELSGSACIEVEFVVTEAEERRIVELLEHEKVRVFYSRIPATFGIINPDATDVPGPPQDD
ncbi:MAG TPA: DUF190 domain-containing protein [Candidatus Accumulibacter phosphatis]|nr:MAG: hypothetical protein AW07_04399 [Candidatus Accumulibacter sp. SK-11]HCV14221.1 DUF190 domain-containing protein [Accumulibacter sp.]HRL78481.1 DUF190 domain-containing protein [Candidatus Accumulibacter phosphatis]HRQ97452.1 DUF190 domain-containing protein [Candidatus Accumulibacter phosphatis]